MTVYYCPVCLWESEPVSEPPPLPCPNCNQDAEQYRPKDNDEPGTPVDSPTAEG